MTLNELNSIVDVYQQRKQTIAELQQQPQTSDITAEIVQLKEHQRIVRHDIVAVVDGYQQGLDLERKENRRERRKLAEDIIGSDDFQSWIELLRGLYYAGGYSTFDELVQSVIPAHCTIEVSREIAHKRDLIIPAPELPKEVKHAKQAIGLDLERNERRAA